MTAGINTSAEILFSSYPPARSIIFSKTASLLFKDYNLKMINKRIRAGIAPICTCNQKKTHQEDSEYSIFVSIFIFEINHLDKRFSRISELQFVESSIHRYWFHSKISLKKRFLY